MVAVVVKIIRVGIPHQRTAAEGVELTASPKAAVMAGGPAAKAIKGEGGRELMVVEGVGVARSMVVAEAANPATRSKAGVTAERRASRCSRIANPFTGKCLAQRI